MKDIEREREWKRDIVCGTWQTCVHLFKHLMENDLANICVRIWWKAIFFHPLTSKYLVVYNLYDPIYKVIIELILLKKTESEMMECSIKKYTGSNKSLECF